MDGGRSPRGGLGWRGAVVLVWLLRDGLGWRDVAAPGWLRGGRGWRALGCLAALAAAVAAGCGQGDGGARGSERSACTPAGSRYFGEAYFHAPARPASRRPLVVAFHGAGGNGLRMRRYTGLSDLGDRAGFAVLYPTAPDGFWTLTPGERGDELPGVVAVLDRVIQAVCIDPRRVYATGVSNGGGFSARLGCELADRFAAVAPVAGGYRALQPCPAGRRTSLLEIHGTGDTVVPYRGRGPRRAGDVRRFVAQWARRDGCESAPRVARVRADVQRVSYRGCAPGLAVEHLKIDDEPHGWPIDTTERVWRFFRDRRLG